MKLNIYSQVCLFLFLMIGISTTAISQNTVSGTVTDEGGEPLIGANVLVKGTTDGTITELDGSFSLRTSSSYPFTLVISYTGFGDQEIIVSDNTPISVSLAEGILIGEDIVISASRKREKIQEAPASISVVGARQLTNSPQVEPLRNLINVPGVQLQQQSAARINIEMRASSGIFGTSTFPIMDYRSLVGPGVGTFQSDAAGLSNIDLERIEIVRGPGSALYGPGVTAGVVHFITKNPIDHPGTTVQVGYGELNTFIGALRHAGRNADKTFGYKINAQYNKGDEFSLDPVEDSTQIAKFKTTIVEPAITNNMVDLTKPGTVLLDIDDLDDDGDGNPMASEWWNVAFNGTLEFRPQDDLSVILSGGYNEASAVFYNDLGEGLSQSSEYWTQARVQKGGLFAQFFYVDNNGGTDERPTFLYQTGNISPVGRKHIEGQVQYNFETPSVLGAEWTVGADYRQALSDTRNFTYGRNEDSDDYRILGGYVQGKFALHDKLDLVLAGRYDDFDFIEEGFFSPRAALVFKPDPKHTFRASYNRAGAPPTALEMNVDFPVNAPAPGVIDFWLSGQSNVQTFGDNPMIDMTLPGAPDLPWGTPGMPLGIAYGAVNGAVLPPLIQALTDNPLTTGLAPFIEDFLLNYSPMGFTGQLVGVNAFENNSLLNDLIDTNKPTTNINNTFEVGYKGLFNDKLSATIDVYYVKRSGFSDFTQIGPLVTLQGADIPNDLGAQVEADITPFLIGVLMQGGLDEPTATAVAGQIAPQIGGAYVLGGQGLVAAAGSALGSAFGAVETDQMPQGDGIVHVPAGYRIFPDANMSYWGTDIGLEYYINSDFSIWANYSYVSETEFRGSDLGVEDDSPLAVYLNVPQHKYRIGANYLPESGVRASLSFQHDDSFYASVGQFTGDTDAKNLIDASVGYNFGNGLAIDVAGTNVFDNEYRAFPNMPKIGRRVIAKATYNFGGN